MPGRSFAVIRPQAIALSRDRAGRDERAQLWAGVVGDIDRLGDRVRVGRRGRAAPHRRDHRRRARALDLRPGDDVAASVKATDIDTYPA